MLPDVVSTRLDDPGVGLRDNGRRVLTYADLRSMVEPADNTPPTREIELHLTGNMERYMWSFNGVKFSDAKPIVLKHGERVRFVLVNDTMMTHPIHLHGLWSDLESADGAFQVRKHTISLNPAQRLTYRVSADARGKWPTTVICCITWRPACSERSWWSRRCDTRHRTVFPPSPDVPRWRWPPAWPAPHWRNPAAWTMPTCRA